MRSWTVPLALVVSLGLLAGCSEETQTGGRMQSVDDTGLPDSPVEEGWIIALPATDASWELLGAHPEDGLVDPPAKVTEADVLATGGAWQPLGPGGRFDMPVTPGQWAVCYLPHRDDGGPFGVLGCAVLEMEEGSRIQAATVQGDFWAEVD